MNDLKILNCKRCGKNVEIIGGIDWPCKTMCCGEAMQELKANTTDAALEKHVPVVEISGNTLKVTVGAVLHPMTEAHFINFIYLVTDKDIRRVDLTPSDQPVATFDITGVKPLKVYEYCNLHGLWVKEL